MSSNFSNMGHSHPKPTQGSVTYQQFQQPRYAPHRVRGEKSLNYIYERPRYTSVLVLGKNCGKSTFIDMVCGNPYTQNHPKTPGIFYNSYNYLTSYGSEFVMYIEVNDISKLEKHFLRGKSLLDSGKRYHNSNSSIANGYDCVDYNTLEVVSSSNILDGTVLQPSTSQPIDEQPSEPTPDRREQSIYIIILCDLTSDSIAKDINSYVDGLGDISGVSANIIIVGTKKDLVLGATCPDIMQLCVECGMAQTKLDLIRDIHYISCKTEPIEDLVKVITGILRLVSGEKDLVIKKMKPQNYRPVDMYQRKIEELTKKYQATSASV